MTVVGLYIAYSIPIFLRWRMGSAFQPGPWTLGNKYKWMCPLAVVEVIVVCVIAFLPTAPGGVPGNADFAWNNGLINYCPRDRRRGGAVRADLVVRVGQELVQGTDSHRRRTRDLPGRGRLSSSGFGPSR